jgi:hypothetical protein
MHERTLLESGYIGYREGNVRTTIRLWVVGPGVDITGLGSVQWRALILAVLNMGISLLDLVKYECV